MSSQRWKVDLIELGQMGRKVPVRVESYSQLDLGKGLYRLEGTTQIKRSKDYVMARMKEANLKVRIDTVGNIFARREGFKSNKGAVMTGSHLDSVINGGMFDGALGVVIALEAIRIINDEGFENERPIEVAIFMGEESSAFKKGPLGSDVLVGKRKADEVLALKNDEGLTLKEALEKLDLRGDFEMDLSNVEYFIEPHIEQGPILDKEQIPIGIVENIIGITWVTVILEGEENHAGTTPMSTRKDALVAAADIVLFVNKRANEMIKGFGGSTVATIGKMLVLPGAPNIIPGKVIMGLDIRDSVEANMKNFREEIIDTVKNLKHKYGVKSATEIMFHLPPCPCSKEGIDAIERAALETNIKAKKMNSGAGHDAMTIAERVKIGMIFVPSVNGISHSPLEWTNWEDIEKGIKVTTQVLKNLSRL